jgi:tRNA (guanosine-2'-O-)-methyltransferase
MDRSARVEAALGKRLGSVVAIAESVRRRHNVSAVLRSCEAFGVHEVHLIAAGFTPALGAARGAERWVRRRRFDTVSDSIAELHGRGFRVYVADFLPDAYTPETVPVDAPIALLFGSELRGVSAEARAAADGAVMIPMMGLTQSLNVSVSAAILLRVVSDRRRALVGADLDAAERARFVAEWAESEHVAEKGRRSRTSG